MSETRGDGIFTPWEEVLSGINRKLDHVLEKLDSKVDNSTFTAHLTSAETRFQKVEEKLGKLEDDKVGREAVQAYRQLFITGSALGGILAIANVIVLAIAIAKGVFG